MLRGKVIGILISMCFGQVLFASAQSNEYMSNTAKYTITIDMKDAYIGGLCILKEDGTSITASIINEFGVSLMTFRYDLEKGRIKLETTIKQLRRPIVKRILKTDFKVILNEYRISSNNKLQLTHVNSRYGISYNLSTL